MDKILTGSQFYIITGTGTKLEKMFDAVKNEMDGNRLRAYSAYDADGRHFIEFIALIIYMQITKVMRNSNLFAKYSVREPLKELLK
jgi:transposase